VGAGKGGRKKRVGACQEQKITQLKKTRKLDPIKGLLEEIEREKLGGPSSDGAAERGEADWKQSMVRKKKKKVDAPRKGKMEKWVAGRAYQTRTKKKKDGRKKRKI